MLLGCADPPDPEPVRAPSGIPHWSTAPHVHWAGPNTEVTQPLAVFLGKPAGAMDQIASHDDVTSFLNDRFHPWFIAPEGKVGGTDEGVLFLDHHGCLLTEPTSPKNAKEWIDTANRALVANQSDHFEGRLLPAPNWAFSLSENHPLNAICNR